MSAVAALVALAMGVAVGLVVLPRKRADAARRTAVEPTRFLCDSEPGDGPEQYRDVKNALGHLDEATALVLRAGSPGAIAAGDRARDQVAADAALEVRARVRLLGELPRSHPEQFEDLDGRAAADIVAPERAEYVLDRCTADSLGRFALAGERARAVLARRILATRNALPAGMAPGPPGG